MSDTTNVVKVDKNDVENHIGEFHEVANFLKERYMNPCDTKSTIIANTNAQFAFNTSQTILHSLGVGIDNEAEVIKSVGVTFEEYDEMVASLISHGYRFPVYVQGD